MTSGTAAPINMTTTEKKFVHEVLQWNPDGIEHNLSREKDIDLLEVRLDEDVVPKGAVEQTVLKDVADLLRATTNVEHVGTLVLYMPSEAERLPVEFKKAAAEKMLANLPCLKVLMLISAGQDVACYCRDASTGGTMSFDYPMIRSILSAGHGIGPKVTSEWLRDALRLIPVAKPRSMLVCFVFYIMIFHAEIQNAGRLLNLCESLYENDPDLFGEKFPVDLVKAYHHMPRSFSFGRCPHDQMDFLLKHTFIPLCMKYNYIRFDIDCFIDLLKVCSFSILKCLVPFIQIEYGGGDFYMAFHVIVRRKMVAEDLIHDEECLELADALVRHEFVGDLVREYPHAVKHFFADHVRVNPLFYEKMTLTIARGLRSWKQWTVEETTNIFYLRPRRPHQQASAIMNE